VDTTSREPNTPSDEQPTQRMPGLPDTPDMPTLPLAAASANVSTPPASLAEAQPRTLIRIGGVELDRRTLLIAGGGVVAGGALVAGIGSLHIPSHLRTWWYDYRHQAAKIVFMAGPDSTPKDLIVFDGALADKWKDTSWADNRTIGDKDAPYQNKPSVSLALTSWQGLRLQTDPFETTRYVYLQCWARGDQSGQKVIVYILTESQALVGGLDLGAHTREGSLDAKQWRLARLPISELQAEEISIRGFVFQAAAQESQGTLYLGDVRFVYDPAALDANGIKKAWAYDLSTVTLAFEDAINAASAGQAKNYALTGVGIEGTVTPLIARYHPSRATVSLTVPAPLKGGSTYQVVANTDAKARHSPVKITSTPLTLTGDLAVNRHTINPDIYGLSLNEGERNTAVGRDMGVRVVRWGGQNKPRYNWKLGNAYNAARDWEFRNLDYGHTTDADRQPSGLADQFISLNRASNATTSLVLPTLGWVAKDRDNGSVSVGVPSQGGPPVQPGGDAIAGYDPTANRKRTSVPSRARLGTPFPAYPNLADPTVAQDEWVNHLTRKFGRAADGGVRYYELDNEPEFWSLIHTDVHPAQQTYEQIRDNMLDYANAIKDVDPTALTVGPNIAHWSCYFYPPIDGGPKWYFDHPDNYHAHGDMPLFAWLLDQIRQRDEAAGRRSLDVFGFHIYPAQWAWANSDDSPTTAALRLRTTRILWDRNYVEESWIKDKMAAIPRIRDWINKYYPGTKIACTEYSWGAFDKVTGAVALADVLGIFGREGVEMAAHWRELSSDEPAYHAFKMYGNYDSHGGTFMGTSFSISSSADSLLTCYASQLDQGHLLLMVVNQSPESDLTPTIQLRNLGNALGGASLKRGKVWRYWPDNNKTITQGPDITLSGSGSAQTLTYTFPAYSITLLRLEV
jgi:Glycoside hydrolase family 44